MKAGVGGWDEDLKTRERLSGSRDTQRPCLFCGGSTKMMGHLCGLL